VEQVRERVPVVDHRPDAQAPPTRPPEQPDASRCPRRHSLRDQVLCALRTALVSGELRPGAVYSAPALATRFDVSATPVREAMQQLVREGAVEVVHNRGFRVASRSVRDLVELAEVRSLIELPVLLRLAGTASPECFEALRPLAEDTVTAARAGDRAGYAEADRAFHSALLGLGGNGQLVEIVDELHRRAQWPTPPGPGDRPIRPVAHAAQHLALLDALSGADLPAVEALVRAHFAAAPQ
jgi:DNA-binding GntR family transcriptional regulator